MELTKETKAKLDTFVRSGIYKAMRPALARMRYENYRRSLQLDLTNRKPYRTKEQKADAEATAVQRKNGSWFSNAPRSYHPEYRPSGQ